MWNNVPDKPISNTPTESLLTFIGARKTAFTSSDCAFPHLLSCTVKISRWRRPWDIVNWKLHSFRESMCLMAPLRPPLVHSFSCTRYCCYCTEKTVIASPFVVATDSSTTWNVSKINNTLHCGETGSGNTRRRQRQRRRDLVWLLTIGTSGRCYSRWATYLLNEIAALVRYQLESLGWFKLGQTSENPICHSFVT